VISFCSAENDVRSLIAAAYDYSRSFGELVETAAVTGARPSQISRLEIFDLQDDRENTRLMMPRSRKGPVGKNLTPVPVPITKNLAERLRAAAGRRASDQRLILKEDGSPWITNQHCRPFSAVLELVNTARAARRETPLPENTTFYALRHSSIVRQLLAGIPIRIVAVNHDTSVVMIERHYSRYINDHADALVRQTLLDTAPLGFSSA
jgi:integrase